MIETVEMKEIIPNFGDHANGYPGMPLFVDGKEVEIFFDGVPAFQSVFMDLTTTGKKDAVRALLTRLDLPGMNNGVFIDFWKTLAVYKNDNQGEPEDEYTIGSRVTFCRDLLSFDI